MVPTVAQSLGESPAQLRATILEEFSAVARFVTNWKSTISPASHTLATNQVESIDEFHNAGALVLLRRWDPHATVSGEKEAVFSVAPEPV